MREIRKILCIVLSFVMMVSIGVPSLTEAKKKAPKLNKKKVTVTVGKTAKLTVKNTKKKAKWSIKAGKKNIKLTKKKKSSVVIKGKKAGKATVMAKVGKKKLTCKVTVVKKENNKNNNTTDNINNTKPSVTAVKLASVTVLNPGTVQVQLTAAQDLKATNFVVKRKSVAHGSYLRALTIASVVSTDKKTYILNLDVDNSELYVDEYVQVTVSGLTGTGTASMETIYKKQFEYLDEYVFSVKVGEKINSEIYESGYGSCEVISKELPKEISYEMVYSSDSSDAFKLTGTFNTVGEKTGKIVYKSESGDVYTVNIVWLVADEDNLVAHCCDTYQIMQKNSTVTAFTDIRINGGSDYYNVIPVNADNVYYDEEEAILRGEFETPGEHKITVKIEDMGDSNISTTCVWTVFMTEGQDITVNIKDAKGNAIKNDDSMGVSFVNQDKASLYELTLESSKNDVGEYYVTAVEGVYDVYMYAHGYQKKVYDVKVDKTTKSIDVVTELYPVHMKLDGMDLSDASWVDTDAGYGAVGDCLYMGKGSYELAGRLIKNGKIYDLSAAFTYEGKELVVPVKLESEKDFSSGSITTESPITVTLEEDYIYYTFVPEESGNYYFYSETEDEYPELKEDTRGILLDKNYEMIDENDDYDGDVNYEFGIEAYCEVGETYYIGIKAYPDYAGLSSELFVVKNEPAEE